MKLYFIRLGMNEMKYGVKIRRKTLSYIKKYQNFRIGQFIVEIPILIEKLLSLTLILIILYTCNLHRH